MVSSSSAARFTAPSAAYLAVQTVDLALQAGQLHATNSMLRATVSTSAWASASSWAYCSSPRRAAWSFELQVVQ